MRPKDLLRRCEPARSGGVRPCDLRRAPHRISELAAADLDDPAGAADLLLLRRESRRLVRLAAGLVCQLSRFGIERERVAFLRVLDGLAALDHGEPEVERVAAEDVAHRRAADDDHLDPGFIGDALEAGGAHFAGAPDREAVAGDDEGLAAVNAFAEVRHEVAKRARLPPRVERIEALRDAVVGRRALIRVDGVELPPRDLGIPEDEGLPADHLALAGSWRAPGRPSIADLRAGNEARTTAKLGQPAARQEQKRHRMIAHNKVIKE